MHVLKNNIAFHPQYFLRIWRVAEVLLHVEDFENFIERRSGLLNRLVNAAQSLHRRSVVADIRRCPQLLATMATVEDVAYAEVAAELRSLVRAHRGRWGLEAALAAMQPDAHALALAPAPAAPLALPASR